MTGFADILAATFTICVLGFVLAAVSGRRTARVEITAWAFTAAAAVVTWCAWLTGWAALWAAAGLYCVAAVVAWRDRGQA